MRGSYSGLQRFFCCIRRFKKLVCNLGNLIHRLLEETGGCHARLFMVVEVVQHNRCLLLPDCLSKGDKIRVRGNQHCLVNHLVCCQPIHIKSQQDIDTLLNISLIFDFPLQPTFPQCNKRCLCKGTLEQVIFKSFLAINGVIGGYLGMGDRNNNTPIIVRNLVPVRCFGREPPNPGFSFFGAL